MLLTLLQEERGRKFWLGQGRNTLPEVRAANEETWRAFHQKMGMNAAKAAADAAEAAKEATKRDQVKLQGIAIRQAEKAQRDREWEEEMGVITQLCRLERARRDTEDTAIADRRASLPLRETYGWSISRKRIYKLLGMPEPVAANESPNVRHGGRTMHDLGSHNARLEVVHFTNSGRKHYDIVSYTIRHGVVQCAT